MDKKLVRRLAFLGAKKRGCDATEDELRFHHRTGAGIQLSNSGLTAKVIDGYTSKEDLTVICNRRMKIGETIRVMITDVGEMKSVSGKVIITGGITKCRPPASSFKALEEIESSEGDFIKNIDEMRLGYCSCGWPAAGKKENRSSLRISIKVGDVRSLHWRENGDVYYGHNNMQFHKIGNTRMTNVYAYFILSPDVKEITIV